MTHSFKSFGFMKDCAPSGKSLDKNLVHCCDYYCQLSSSEELSTR